MADEPHGTSGIHAKDALENCWGAMQGLERGARSFVSPKWPRKSHHFRCSCPRCSPRVAGGVLATVTSIQYTEEQGFGAREEPHLVVLVSGPL